MDEEVERVGLDEGVDEGLDSGEVGWVTGVGEVGQLHQICASLNLGLLSHADTPLNRAAAPASRKLPCAMGEGR